MLILHKLLYVLFTLHGILCIFWNKPINKMPQCQFLFFAIFIFQKIYIGNILGIGQNKSRSSYLSDTKKESKGETEPNQEAATP
jgi:hypothetical protein